MSTSNAPGEIMSSGPRASSGGVYSADSLMIQASRNAREPVTKHSGVNAKSPTVPMRWPRLPKFPNGSRRSRIARKESRKSLPCRTLHRLSGVIRETEDFFASSPPPCPGSRPPSRARRRPSARSPRRTLGRGSAGRVAGRPCRCRRARRCPAVRPSRPGW